MYGIGAAGDIAGVRLDSWHVVGPFTSGQDSMMWRDFMADPRHSTLAANPDTTVRLWHNGPYRSKYGSPDLREVFGIVPGDTLRQLPVGTMECYPLRLRAGDNTLCVKARGRRRRYFYDASLYDSTAFARLYAEQHTGSIVEPIITGDTVTLTEAHANIYDGPVRLLFHDVQGRMAAGLTLHRDSLRYLAAGLERNHAYICSMVMAGDTVRQPVMTWSMDEAGARFRFLRDSLPAGHPRAGEIDQLLYRVWKLGTVTGAMRSDKWFPFKQPWVVYQLEHAFAHLDGTYGNDGGEYNLRFVTYRSRLDGCPQRYILVTPNHVDRNRKYPLVVVVRPNGDKRHHLFASPQISHQYAVNDMQAVADKYGFFCIMPEARMLQDEDLMPFAETEMKLALADVQEHYNIDGERIFILANCSGGGRALRLAELNPGMFAGMALYAPSWRRDGVDGTEACVSPLEMVENLGGMPVMIYGDPVDAHSPLGGYMPLVDAMEEAGVDVSLMLRRNTAHGAYGYHRLVVGRDALEFFSGISGRRKAGGAGSYRMPPRNAAVADFYGRPFIYVYNSADTSAVYRNLVDGIRAEYESYLYARLPLDTASDVRMPLLPDTRVTRSMLEEYNVFLIGEDFVCHHVMSLAREAGRSKPKMTSGEVTLTACGNPYNKDGMALLYTSAAGSHFGHVINYPWKDAKGAAARSISKASAVSTKGE